jgi:glycerol kinase
LSTETEYPVVLAIDQSTSASKALLFDLQGGLIDRCSLEHRQIYPRPGWVEHDAEEIYRNTLQAIRTLLDRQPSYRSRLHCLSLTNQRETVVVFEKGSGRPLYPAIVWQCRRGVALCEALAQAGYNDLVHRVTGLKLDAYFSASKLRWLIDAHPEIARQLQQGQALIGTIDAYLIYRLTGGRVHGTDPTNASRTLLFDIARLAWDPALCDLFHVPMQALPELRESSAIFGQTDLEGLLDQPLPICGVMGDSQAALFAQRCFEPGTAKATFGSGSSLLLNIGDRLQLSQAGIVSTLAWVYGGRATYAFEGIINYSGATVSWLKDQLALVQSAAETEQLAQAVEDNGGVYLVPAFVGLSAPYWQPDARAAILGMTPATSREHIVRAALEAMAYQVKDVLELMVAEAGVALQCLYADGGPVRNRFLMQFVADLIRYPLRVPGFAELSALGAVFSGYLGTGVAGSLEQLRQLPQPYSQYDPVMSPEKAAALYAGWQAAVRRVL